MTRRLLFFFLDGVGLGVDDAAVNPLVAAKMPFLGALLGGKVTASLEARAQDGLLVRAIDPRLGYPGLPQSATGQTALLTGRNAAQIMKGHYGPWPGPTLKAELDKGTLFSELLQAGRSVCFANAFPPGYFTALAQGVRKVNVPVYAALGAGLQLQTTEHYRQGRAVSADLTGAYLHQLEARNPVRTPAGAGRVLAEIAADNELTFFDFWLTDSAGHRWPLSDAARLAEQLDAFLSGLIPALDKTTLLITSDHGNFEDKRVRGHTLNPVPLIALGPGAASFAEVSSVLEVADGVRAALKVAALP